MAKPGPMKQHSFQVGGLFSKTHANRLAGKLKKMGYPTRLVKLQDLARQDWWYVVRVGHFYTPEEAGEAAEIFTRKTGNLTSVPD